MCKISVIVPVYNAEDTLETALSSVFMQTLTDIEILCINDGSTDHSADVLTSAQRRDGRVRCLTQENAGAGMARNKGIAEAKGEYIAFLDADDLYPGPYALETLLAAAEKSGAMVCGGSIEKAKGNDVHPMFAVSYTHLDVYKRQNYYRHIDRTRVQFDFLTHRAREGAYDKEIYALGGKVFTVPRQNPFSPAYRHALHKFFSAHPAYTVVHAHLDCLSGVVLGCAKQHGVPVRIAHAHTTNQMRDFKYPIKDLYKRIIPRTATDLLACGEDAGRWMFGSAPFLVLPVAIDTGKFRFDKNMREDMRRTLGITKEELLIGHVGQFRKEKNQTFLLDVLHSLRACGTKSKLLFVGDGEKRAAVQNRAAALGLTPYVLFLGVREDVPALLHAMDVFLSLIHI